MNFIITDCSSRVDFYIAVQWYNAVVVGTGIDAIIRTFLRDSLVFCMWFGIFIQFILKKKINKTIMFSAYCVPHLVWLMTKVRHTMPGKTNGL